MKKPSVLLVFALAASLPLNAQQGKVFTLVTSFGINACIDYPKGWSAARFDLPGTYLGIFTSSEMDQSDPFDLPSMWDFTQSGVSCATATLMEKDSPLIEGLSEVVSGLEADPPVFGGGGVESIRKNDTTLFGAAGRIYVIQTSQGKVEYYFAVSETAKGETAVFMAGCAASDSSLYRDLFARMQASFRAPRPGEAGRAGASGFTRVASGELVMDTPTDWYSHYIESPVLDIGLFSKGKLDIDTLQGLGSSEITDFFPMAFVMSGSPEAFFGGEASNSQAVLDEILSGFGSVDRIVSRSQVSIGGIGGQRVVANITLDNESGGGKAGLYAIAAFKAQGNAYMFIGLALSEGFAAAQKQFDTMYKSITFK
jgi:hypothetical protein